MTIKTFNINTDKTAFVRAYLPDSVLRKASCCPDIPGRRV